MGSNYFTAKPTKNGYFIDMDIVRGRQRDGTASYSETIRPDTVPEPKIELKAYQDLVANEIAPRTRRRGVVNATSTYVDVLLYHYVHPQYKSRTSSGLVATKFGGRAFVDKWVSLIRIGPREDRQTGFRLFRRHV